MDPRLRTALAYVAAALLAVFLGERVAEGAYAWPALAAVLAVATVLVRFTGLAADTIFVGLLLIGYLVGNRGFAQLMPAPGIPLFPAEAGLLIAVAWRTVICGFERRLPFRPDALNWAVLVWLVTGTVRVAFDLPNYGFMAVRDYAVIYYAVFFFIVQHMGRDPAARRYLTGCLLFAVVALVPMFSLFQFFPDFFLNQLTVFHVPLIFYKGDLAATFMGLGSLLVFHWAKGLQRYWAWPLSAAMILFLLSYDSRASLLGVVLASGLLLLARRWRFPALQGGLTALALLIVILLAVLFDNTWANRKLHGLQDRIQSITDISGSGRYDSEESYFKGDNNRFRLVWWRNVVEMTWTTNPLFGLGFGADLAQGFVQEYYPDATLDFNTRSPHNIFLTVFGRMGLAGVAVWTAFCAVLLIRTLLVLRHSPDPVQWSLWCAPWVILCSATFGVVLEGPMGAVVFWTLLGLANSYPPAAEAGPATSPPGTTASLPAAAAGV